MFPGCTLCSHKQEPPSTRSTGEPDHMPTFLFPFPLLGNPSSTRNTQPQQQPCPTAASTGCTPLLPHTQPAGVEAVVLPLFQVTGVKHSIRAQVVLTISEDLSYSSMIPSQQGLPEHLGRAIHLLCADGLPALISSPCDAAHDNQPEPPQRPGQDLLMHPRQAQPHQQPVFGLRVCLPAQGVPRGGETHHTPLFGSGSAQLKSQLFYSGKPCDQTLGPRG